MTGLMASVIRAGVLTEKQERTIGSIHASSSMVERAAGSSAQPHSYSPAQSEGAATIINSDNPELAQQAVDS